MQRDPQVDLIFSHFIPRYEATGVDPNDLRALMPRVTQWQDSCRLWSEEGARHEALGEAAKAKGYRRTAAESFVRAAMYYHYGKHLFADRPEGFQRAHEAMLRCYSAGAAHLDPPIERVEFHTGAWRCRGGCASRAASRGLRSRSSCRGSMPARRSCMPGRRASSIAASPL